MIEEQPALRVRCIVGLGNPGPEYARTRHNAGFLVLDRLLVAGLTVPPGAGSSGASVGGGCPTPSPGASAWHRDGRAEVLEVWDDVRDLLLIRPLTYMNRSGLEVARLLEAHAVLPGECLVVTDDVTLPVGRIRVRPAGSSGGHRGLQSIEQELGTQDYPRVRVGVGGPPPGVDLAEFVLEPLQGEAWDSMLEAVGSGTQATLSLLRDGLVTAMNRWNARV
ncbi:MAG: aminoacyl-tRNA hydrolase [Candidatus Eisenbacteria bacterium]|nr:aminoacyl-tRNA hydrolase [Candidatus Eisenbacteria bacterium]